MSDYSGPNSSIGNDGGDGLAASARNLASHAEELLQNTASISNEGIAALRKKLTESLSAARAQISDAQSYAMERGKQAATVTDSYVRENPWQAIAVAALFGVVIGFMSRSSRN